MRTNAIHGAHEARKGRIEHESARAGEKIEERARGRYRR